jgi:hypothetical protein
VPAGGAAPAALVSVTGPPPLAAAVSPKPRPAAQLEPAQRREVEHTVARRRHDYSGVPSNIERVALRILAKGDGRSWSASVV